MPSRRSGSSGPRTRTPRVERFAQRIEERLFESRRPARRRQDNTAITVVSLIVAIPMIAIAGGIAQEAGIAIVCLALVLVNFFARRG